MDARMIVLDRHTVNRRGERNRSDRVEYLEDEEFVDEKRRKSCFANSGIRHAVERFGHVRKWSLSLSIVSMSRSRRVVLLRYRRRVRFENVRV